MRYLLPLLLVVAGCTTATDQIPSTIQGDWVRHDRLSGRSGVAEVSITLEPLSYTIDGIKLDLNDIRAEDGAVTANAVHDVKVDTVGFDLGWKVEHEFSWTLDGDSLRESHRTVAIFPDTPNEPLETTIDYVYSRN